MLSWIYYPGLVCVYRCGCKEPLENLPSLFLYHQWNFRYKMHVYIYLILHRNRGEKNPNQMQQPSLKYNGQTISLNRIPESAFQTTLIFSFVYNTYSIFDLCKYLRFNWYLL